MDPSERASLSALHVQTPRTARVVLCGNRKAAREVWFVLHGYAETADEFIQHLAPFATEERLFVAPEGLSRFYRRGMRGEVGASWMTSRDRTHEIDDYVAYLNRVRDRITEGSPSADSLNVLGFSQGAATAARWMSRSNESVDQLVLWGGGIPDDVEVEALQASLNRTIIVTGSKDPYIAENDVSELLDRMERGELMYDHIRYDGKHNLNGEALQGLFSELDSERA